MATNEIKVNLDLMNALIKIREASILFDEQVVAISEESGLDYIEEGNTFNHGVHECINAISKMIGESVVNGVYTMIPDKN